MQNGPELMETLTLLCIYCTGHKESLLSLHGCYSLVMSTVLGSSKGISSSESPTSCAALLLSAPLPSPSARGSVSC